MIEVQVSLKLKFANKIVCHESKGNNILQICNYTINKISVLSI